MSFTEKILNALRQNKSQENIIYRNKTRMPEYFADSSWEQDSKQSITTDDGKYDLRKFSKHESDTVKYVWNVVQNKYPLEYRSIGLANESYAIKYKARYILFEIIILLYKDSEQPIDKFAVALAYESKGAFYRKQAIQYFESAKPYISDEFMNKFIFCSPLRIYNAFAKLYEQEHNFQKAIEYTSTASTFCVPESPYYKEHIEELLRKQSTSPKLRNLKMSESRIKFENDTTEAAKYFIKHKELPLDLDCKKESTFNVEEYAMMCNAYLEHQDALAQYETSNN